MDYVQIVGSIMDEHFADDNTFSKSNKNYAIIGVLNTDKDMPEVNLNLITKEIFLKEYLSKNFKLHSMMGLKPVIKFIKE